MNRLFLAFALLLISQVLPAQDVTYVVFNRDCMSQLVYRYAYPNVKGDAPVYAYAVKPNVLENYVFIAEGSGHYSPTMPEGAITCGKLNLNDGFIAGLNRGDRQVLIVFQRQEGGYWLMPIGSATLIAKNGPKYWIRSKNCSFIFDTLHLDNDVNLAITGSPTAVYFTGSHVNNCLMEYSFHCESPKSGELKSDIELIPSLGFSTDRTGTSTAKAMENEMKLYRINGQFAVDFINDACPEQNKLAVPSTQKPAQYGDNMVKPTYGLVEQDKEKASITTKIADNAGPDQFNYEGTLVTIDCPELLGEGYHVVQKGDNLRAISRTYNVDMQTLVKWNDIKDPNLIEVCDVVWYQKPPVGYNKMAKTLAAKTAQYVSNGYYVIDQRKLNKVDAAGKGTTPVTSDVQPNEFKEFANTTGAPRPLIHTVEKGEYLYKIARMYDCPDDCIRQANKMPASGNVTLEVGDRIVIPECDCLNPSGSVSKNTPYDEPLNSYAKKEKMQRASTVLDPQTYNTDDQKSLINKTTGVDEWPVDDKVKTSLSTNNPQKSTTPTSTVPQFKEHLARQGDTIRSIATKYKVDPAELAQVNGLGLNEAVTPGKWILVPIH